MKTPAEFNIVRPFQVEALFQELKAFSPAVAAYKQISSFLKHAFERIDKGDNLITLLEAREFLRKTRGGGAICPCCDQFVKVYKRAITKEMAGCLVELVMKYYATRDWVPVRELETRGGDYAKLLWWELIEFETTKTGSARAAGGMRPTKLGLRFALNRLKVPSHVLLYNNRMLGHDGKEIGINEVPNFNYSEIRASVEKAEVLL